MAPRIREMLREPSIELCLLIRRQDEFGLTLIIGEAFPKRHGKLYPVLGRKLQKGSKGVRQHA
jgi:hypothetical protein